MRGAVALDTKKTYIPKKEFRAYYTGAMGQGMVYGIMSSYISDFYLNVLRVTPIFVLLLMLLARVWDAINDPIMGIIMDRSQPKKGKMRPYIIYMVVPIAVLTFFLFFAPNLSLRAKMIYAGITYVLWGMIYTVADVPFWSLPNAMTPNPDERGKLISISRTANGVGSAVPMALFMILGFVLPKAGVASENVDKVNYMIIAVVASVIGCTLFGRVYFKVNERVNIPIPKKREPGTPGTLKLVFTCKPLMLVAAMGILSAGRYMYQAAAIHMARYVFYIGAPFDGMSGEEITQAALSSKNTVLLVLSGVTAAGMFGTMLIVPKLIEKYSYKNLVIVSSLIGSAASFAMFFVGYENFWLCLPFLFVSSIPLGVINVVSYAMIGDALDYMEWKTGRRHTGLGSACQSFVLKLGNALATCGIILAYIIVKLDISTIGTDFLPDPNTLTSAVRTGMFSLISLVPAISLLLCTIPMFFYDLTGDKKERVTRELAVQRQERGIFIEQS